MFHIVSFNYASFPKHITKQVIDYNLVEENLGFHAYLVYVLSYISVNNLISNFFQEGGDIK